MRLRLLACNDTGFFEPGFRSSPTSSVRELDPGSSLITALGELGIDPAVDFHSIIPARGRGTCDGIVPRASAHLEGAASELFVPAGHACLEERDVIRETARILAEHIRMTGKDSSQLVLGVAKPRGESRAMVPSGSEIPATKGIP